KVYRRSPFKKMYCPAAAGDAGGAIGAAMYVQSKISDQQNLTSDLRPLISAYLGPEASEKEILALIDWKKKELADAGCTIAYLGDEEKLVKRAAQAIADGKI